DGVHHRAGKGTGDRRGERLRVAVAVAVPVSVSVVMAVAVAWTVAVGRRALRPGLRTRVPLVDGVDRLLRRHVSSVRRSFGARGTGSERETTAFFVSRSRRFANVTRCHSGRFFQRRNATLSQKGRVYGRLPSRLEGRPRSSAAAFERRRPVVGTVLVEEGRS